MKIKLQKLINSLSKLSLTLVVLGILALVNFILSFFPLRLDLTSNRAFTLSKVTEEKLANLPDIINIKVFISQSLPTRLLLIRQSLADVLQEYERLGRGKIKVSYLDPKDDLDKKQQALSLGVPELRFSDIEANKLALTTGYLGLALIYGEKNEAMAVIEDAGNLEYELTSRINKLTKEKTAVVGILSGYGEKELFLGRRILETEFEIREINIKNQISNIKNTNEKLKIDEDIVILLVAGPSEEFSDEAKGALWEYVDKGGSLLLALDGVAVANNLQAGPVGHNLFDLVEKFGLKLNSDLVLSASNEVANFSAGATMFFTPYPFWVKIQKEGFNEEITALAGLETAMFPWISSIEIKNSTLPALPDRQAGKIKNLIKTTPQSWKVAENFNLDPTSIDEPKEEELAEVVVGAMVEGLGNQGDGSGQGKVILIGDSDWLEDELLQRFEANAVLLLNLVDFLATGGELAGIRSKGVIFRPLREMSDSAKETVKYGNLLLGPVLLGVGGGLRLWKRRTH